MCWASMNVRPIIGRPYTLCFGTFSQENAVSIRKFGPIEIASALLF
jgi:hypothetical protein